MTTSLGPEVQRRVDSLFSTEDRETATHLLVEMQESADFDQGICEMERAHSAALKVSHGDLERLRKAIQVGRTDLRDLLSAASFGSLEAHKNWTPKPGQGSWWERKREKFFGIR